MNLFLNKKIGRSYMVLEEDGIKYHYHILRRDVECVR